MIPRSRPAALAPSIWGAPIAHRMKQVVKRFTIVKRLGGWYRARQTDAYRRRWQAMLAGTGNGTRSPQAPRVLLATSLGAYQPGTRLDAVLATALRLRGAEVAVWLCDASLPACQLADAYFYPDQGRFLRGGLRSDLCPTCYAPAAALYRGLDVPVHTIGSYLSTDDAKAADLATRIPAGDIPGYHDGGIPVGEQALAGALRFFASGSLDGEPQGEAVLRAYLRAALLTARAVGRAIDRERWDCVVMHHGLYVPQGVIAEVCRARGVRVVTWHPAYRKNCFTFVEGDTYHRSMIAESTSAWETMPWSAALDARMLDYLASRRRGTRDWIVFNRRPAEDLPSITAALGLDPARPWIGLLTNVMWDAQLHYPSNAFHTMYEWLVRTVEYFAGRPDLQLIIRVHPAEVTGRLPARQRVVGELSRAFPALPSNVRVIPPESPISTYAVTEKCDAVLIYATKMGVELAALGIPVVTAGEAWIRGKGFSLDASTPDEYFRILQRLPLGTRLDPASTLRARKYAFHYFFRRMIPLEFVRQAAGVSLALDVRLDGPDALRPGRSRGLDVICDGILERRDFIYPAEMEEVRTAETHVVLP